MPGPGKSGSKLECDITDGRCSRLKASRHSSIIDSPTSHGHFPPGESEAKEKFLDKVTALLKPFTIDKGWQLELTGEEGDFSLLRMQGMKIFLGRVGYQSALYRVVQSTDTPYRY